MAKKNLRKLIYFISSPLILWCFGWKFKKFWGGYFWRDPTTGYWWTGDIAIKICEGRILND